MVKHQIRQKHLQKRSNLQDKKYLDKKIEASVLDFAKDYDVIAIFNSFGDEIHTKGMIEKLIGMGKIVACPKIVNKEMFFIKVESINDFKIGYFNIEEPIGDEIIEDFDLIIVPLLAFNHEMYRIGYGGGFYDKFLKESKAFKLGIAYEWKAVTEQFQDPHDIKLDAICTEARIIYEETSH